MCTATLYYCSARTRPDVSVGSTSAFIAAPGPAESPASAPWQQVKAVIIDAVFCVREGVCVWSRRWAVREVHA